MLINCGGYIEDYYLYSTLGCADVLLFFGHPLPHEGKRDAPNRHASISEVC